MDILQLIDRLEELFNDAKAVPFTHNVVVDEDKMLELIDQLRIAIPEEVKKAQEIRAQPILNNDGAIILLMENNNMATYADLLPNRIEKTDDPQSSVLQWQYGNNIWNNYWNSTGYSNVYGVPAGQPFVGEFKVDIENGVIILHKDFRRDYIMLEYVSSPMEGGEYYLPVQFREALIAWMAWKDGNAKSIKSNMMLGDKRDKRDEFYNERRQAIARWRPIRLQEQMQTSLEMSRLAVKV